MLKAQPREPPGPPAIKQQGNYAAACLLPTPVPIPPHVGGTQITTSHPV